MRSIVLTILVFSGCLCVGFWIAEHKPLWNDEYFTQTASVDGTSFADQFSGNLPLGEGSHAPLFYALQKLFLQVVRYQTPLSWHGGHWYTDPHSQITLRAVPVILMSLSVSLVFYYFCLGFSLWVGLLSLFIFLSSHMVWSYWAEARPYALWVFLTTVQSVILLNSIGQKSRTQGGRGMAWLAGTNILLGLTSILTLGEIWVVSVLWWCVHDRDWKKYIVATFLPTLIVIFYYIHAPRLSFYFGQSHLDNFLHDNISSQCFDVLFIFLFFLSLYFWGQKKGKVQDWLGDDIVKPFVYVIFWGLVLASSIVLYIILGLHAKPNQGFPVTSRYFIYLTPIGVIATTIVTVSLLKSLSKHQLLCWGLGGLIGFLLVQHFLKIVPKTIHAIISNSV